MKGPFRKDMAGAACDPCHILVSHSARRCSILRCDVNLIGLHVEMDFVEEAWVSYNGVPAARRQPYYFS